MYLKINFESLAWSTSGELWGESGEGTTDSQLLSSGETGDRRHRTDGRRRKENLKVKKLKSIKAFYFDK